MAVKKLRWEHLALFCLVSCFVSSMLVERYRAIASVKPGTVWYEKYSNDPFDPPAATNTVLQVSNGWVMWREQCEHHDMVRHNTINYFLAINRKDKP